MDAPLIRFDELLRTHGRDQVAKVQVLGLEHSGESDWLHDGLTTAPCLTGVVFRISRGLGTLVRPKGP